MKKVLFATTALIATAGIASADIKLNGNARIGLVYNDAAATEVVLEHRMRVNILASGETDTGLSFGGRIQLRSDENNGVTNGNGTQLSGARVHVSGGGFTLAAGNIYGVIDGLGVFNIRNGALDGLSYDSMVVQTYGPTDNGAAAPRVFNYDRFEESGDFNGANGVEIYYTAGAFTGRLSYSDAGGFSGANGQTGEDIGVSVSYKFGDWTAGLGMVDSSDDTRDKTVATLAGKIADVEVGLHYANNDGVDKIGAYAAKKFGDLTLRGFVSDEDNVGVETIYGFTASYNLGGGASLDGGLENRYNGTTYGEFGITLNF